VIGDKYFYAWHHDGVELRDGDGDPQTWGILSTVGDEFVAPIALARLDSVPGLDIIGVSYWTLEVFCINYLGDVLTGWPKTLSTNCRTAPVAADLDGDGDSEIVVVDQWAKVYAWHADGTEVRDGDSNPSTDGVFIQLTHTGGWNYQVPAACDLDDDDKDELIIGTLADSVYALNEDGSSVPGWPVGTNGDVAGGPAVGDVDNDGQFEVVVASRGGGGRLYIINHDGSYYGNGYPRTIPSDLAFNPSLALANLTGDDYLEVIMASSDRSLYVIDYLGNDVNGFPVEYSPTTYTESSPVIADIDGDGILDIVLGDEAKYINAWDAGGNLLTGYPISTQDAIRATPVIDDLDGDGDTDLAAAGWDAHVYVWDLNGVYDEDLSPWPMFHANSHRNGQIGYKVPTAIQSVTFNYQVLRESVELVWMFPSSNDFMFDIYRKALGSGISSSYVKIHSSVNPSGNGTPRMFDAMLEPGMSYVYKLEVVGDSDTSFETKAIYIPIARADLLQNHPNPFNPTTNITFYVPDGSAQKVSLKIYDVTGALVKTVEDGVFPPGRYVRVWDGTNNRGNTVGSGIYFYQLREKNFVSTKKMVLLK
jgi:hypothetical protein